MYPFAAMNVVLLGTYTGSRVVLSLLALKLGAGEFTVGVLFGLYALFSLLVAVHAGRMADRVGLRVPMLAGALAITAGLILPGLLPRLETLFASAILVGAGFLFWNVAVQSLTGSLAADAQQRARNFSTLSLSFALANFVGPLAAGVLIDATSHATTYLVLAAATVIPIAMVSRQRGLPGPRPPEAAASQAGALELVRAPRLLRTLVVSGLVVTGSDLFVFYLPILGHSINLSASTIGVVLGIFAIAQFIARYLMPALSKRFGNQMLLSVAMFAGSVVFLALPFSSDLVLIGVLSFGVGLFLGVGQPLTMMLVYNRAPEGRSGEVMGFRLTVTYFMHFAVPVAAGAAGGVFGMVTVFWINAALLAACGHLARRT